MGLGFLQTRHMMAAKVLARYLGARDTQDRIVVVHSYESCWDLGWCGLKNSSWETFVGRKSSRSRR